MVETSGKPRTLYDKIWDDHVVDIQPDGTALLYIDRHLVHEVTSPQAFEGLRLAHRKVHSPQKTLAVVDHNVPTTDRYLPIQDPESKAQVEQLAINARDFGVEYFDEHDRRQGVVHIIGPEQGYTLPGATIVCGDSHTSTHGAFGALAFGIGTSEVEHVLATQSLPQARPATMAVTVDGELAPGVTAKDVALTIIGAIGTGGGIGHIIEYRGSAIRSLSMEGRMTLCNMSIEEGARAGMVAPDETTFAYVEGKRFAPRDGDWEKAVEYWRSLRTDEGAAFDKLVEIDAAQLCPFVTWGTNPGMVAPVTGRVPEVSSLKDADRRATELALRYMGIEPGRRIEDICVDRVFIGSCTNSRLEDLRAAARVAKGHHVSAKVRAMVVPGSQTVKRAAEQEGLHQIFLDAGFEWRESGCSRCLGMNPDILQPGERCASTSNRNFEGRQGRGGRTHLVSPMMAAAAAITGHFTDIRNWRFQ